MPTTEKPAAETVEKPASPPAPPSAAPAATPPPPAPPPAPPGASHAKHKPWKLIIALLVLAALIVFGFPEAKQAFNTVSTDDAYVNGHVTLVAPRVAGQVARVLVDDNNRVHKGQLLVQLDPEPFQVQVNIAQAALTAANADLTTAQAQVRGFEGQTRSLRFSLEHAIEDVDDQEALLRSKVATLKSEQASLVKAQGDYDRAQPLAQTGGVSKDEIEQRREALLVGQSRVEEALQGVYQVRVNLGLPAQPEKGTDLTQVPDDLDQTFSTVKQAQASLIQAAAQIGYSASFSKSPKDMIADFYKQDPEGNIDRIYEQLLASAPTVKQAQARVTQAQHVLDQAQLNLRYCDVVAEIDGIVAERNENPGNNVVAGQSLMAVRSLTEIWIDANFKETQLANLSIGLPVDLDVDMYGSRKQLKGRISGFTAGTGSTLALLPAENATGNFVKVVQRLPVRIDLVDYDAEKTPLFLGLSVTPHVLIKESPSGPDAGKQLQTYLAENLVPAADAATSPASPASSSPAITPGTHP